ncbi:MAG: FMN-binding protein [Actinobacteria bacterium HGW-Actinobacteria-8]|nr:MAG: FMN-binding protein [Actinobacteria bacterium HGW-Actinobacteria-8]
MKRNRAALVTSVSTAMLGAGWAAGVVGTAVAAQDTPLATTVGAAGAQPPSIDTPTGTSASSSASTSATATDPAAAATAPAAPSGTFDGATARTRYGDYQAQITVEAGAITSIAMLKSGANDGTSRQLSGYALPRLIEAVLQSQTAKVAYVSGASYTSQGFVASVQDAMAQAGL